MLNPTISRKIQEAFQLSFHVTKKGHAVVYAPWCPIAWKSNGQIRRSHLVIWLDGRSIPEGHLVHHRDGNKLNDSPANLEVMLHRTHTSEHWHDGDSAARGQRISEALMGHAVLDETRRKISAAGMGKANAAGKRTGAALEGIRRGTAERERKRYEAEFSLMESVQQMYKEGTSSHKIAAILGISKDRVLRLLHR